MDAIDARDMLWLLAILGIEANDNFRPIEHVGRGSLLNLGAKITLIRVALVEKNVNLIYTYIMPWNLVQ